MEAALEKTAKDYSERPLDFNSENDLQARLYEETRELLNSKQELETPQTRGFTIENNGSQPAYAQRYHRDLESSLKQAPLSRVRTELTVWHPLGQILSSDERPLDKDDRTEILDLAVLKDQFDRPVHLVNGRHRIEIEMVETAVELKYPRSLPCMPSNKQGSVTDLSDDRLRQAVDFERVGIAADIEELESLGKEYNITPYLFISSQYDIFRRGRYTEERHQLLADAAVEKLRNTCSRTSVLYSYPRGHEWLVNHN
jgi:hypothetical protein